MERNSPNRPLADSGGRSLPKIRSSGLTTPDAIALVSELSERYQLVSIRPLLEICKAIDNRIDLNIAVLGRFKAGKSSFLNFLIGRDILPVGVVPVTAVITEIGYGREETALVRFTGGRESPIPLTDLRLYVTEAENPLNRQHAGAVVVRLPELARWPDLRFIDTPGLESAFAHNTEASLGWAPNVDIALIAIGVDPPLSERDIGLIETLLRYTPRVAVLLTKADILEPAQLEEVVSFVHAQLAARFSQTISIYPYSTRPGFEKFRSEFEVQLLERVANDVASQRRAISERKLSTLLADCEQYIRLTLKSAELRDSDRLQLARQLSMEKDALADTQMEIRLVAQHALATTRIRIERALAPYERVLGGKLLSLFEERAAAFPRVLGKLIDAFSEWLHDALSNELLAISTSMRSELATPLADVQRQYRWVLQNFRDRLSDRTLALYGVPLKTTEPDIVPQPPRMPDVSIGKVFDHNWELLSPLLPMSILRGPVLSRFRRKIADETFKNLSRLTTQWEDIVTAAIVELRGEAGKRIAELLTTVEGLVSASSHSAPQIRADLDRLEHLAAKRTEDGRIDEFDHSRDGSRKT